MEKFEYNYDASTIFAGTIEEIHDATDHEFGSTKVVTHNVDLSIIVYINMIDFDVTSSIKENSPKSYELFKTDFLTKYLEGK